MTTSTERLRARLDAAKFSTAMVARAREIFGSEFDQLSANPVDVLRLWQEVDVHVVSEQGRGVDSCSVAGMYVASKTPPVIAIASANRSRMGFTGLHELGHHLLQTNDSLVELLFERDDNGAVLEEFACDLFASSILIPSLSADSILGDSTPSAVAVRELWQAVEASRAACCVEGAKRLTTDGMVLLLSSAGVVEFASSRGLPPVRRGSTQEATGMWREIASRPTATVHGRTRFRYLDDVQGEELWFQAIPAGAEHWFVVAATERVPWQTMALPSFEKRVVGYWWTCELCDHLWESFEAKHPPCGTPVCPECDRCSCRLGVAQERQCVECFILRPPSQFAGDEPICMECTG